MAAGMEEAAGVHLMEEEDIVHRVDLLQLRRKGHLQELILSSGNGFLLLTLTALVKSPLRNYNNVSSTAIGRHSTWIR